MNPDDLRELADSIREHGIIQPLIVSREHDGSHYILIAGERRLEAARLVKLGNRFPSSCVRSATRIAWNLP